MIKGVDDRDPGDHGQGRISTGSDGAVSGVTSRGSDIDTGRDGRGRPDDTGHITGASRALYCAIETVLDVPTGDDSLCVTEVTARAAFRTGMV